MIRWRPLFRSMLLSVAVLTLAGCLGFGQSEVVEDEAPTAPVVAPSARFDFEDIQVPGGLKMNPEGRFVYETENIKTGVLTFTGGGSTTEVLDFFQATMPKDGWASLASFKSNKSILIYTKPKKVCLIIVEPPRGAYESRVEIWVAPLKPGQDLQPAVQSLGRSETGVVPLAKPQPPKEETLPASK